MSRSCAGCGRCVLALAGDVVKDDDMAEQGMVAEVTSILNARGERMGHARQAVVEVLADASVPLTVEDIRTALAANHASAHRTSIYRTVEALSAAGVVQATDRGASPTVYQLATLPHRQVLAQCRACGTQIRLPKSILAQAKRVLADEHGFQLHPCHVALSGLCRTCLEGEGKGRG